MYCKKISITLFSLLLLGLCNAQIQEYHASDIQEYHATELKPAIASKNTDRNTGSQKHNLNNLQALFGLFQYWVPGTSYSVADYTNQKLVLHNSAGTGVLPGSLQIKPGGSYTWNSSYDGKILKGHWEKTSDPGYPIELIKAQEGKNWKIGFSTDKSANIVIWDGNTWYLGKKL